ncbi:MAG: AAA family ATPase [Phascolarctobacterium sp.]|nr:AAA family ATPase [Phascolarctobacterium sp.]
MSTHLNPIELNELLDTTFRINQPLIENFLYGGTYLLVGPPKVGKSFLVTQIGYHVASGLHLWGLPTKKKKVLYISLEDTFGRLQQRYTQMFGLESGEIGNDFIFATEADFIGAGLIPELESFISNTLNVGLIIIDTLQKVRPLSEGIAGYASDYSALSSFKYLTDKYGICILLVHHTRKLDSSDAFDMISGTNGLLGAADGAIVINKNKRIENKATINIVGRDQPDMQIAVEFNRSSLIWELSQEPLSKTCEKNDPLIVAINSFLKESWSGTATELLQELKIDDIAPNILTRRLNVMSSKMLSSFNIFYSSKHRRERIIFLKRISCSNSDDGDDSSSSIQATLQPSPSSP